MKAMNMMKSIALAAVMMIANQASAANNANADKRGHSNGYSINIQVSNNRVAVPAQKDRHYNTVAIQGHGHNNVVAKPIQECRCSDCKKLHKQMDKHMKKCHQGKQNRMSCLVCQQLSKKFNDMHRMPAQPQHPGHCLHNRH